MRISSTLRVSAAVLLAALAGCGGDVSMPVNPRSELVGDVTVALISAPTLDELARVAPSFGGFYIAKDRTPTVYLGDAGERGAITSALGGFLASHGMSESAVRVVPAAFRYEELNSWFDEAASAFDIPGVTLVDLDESRNRVVIGVDPSANRGAVRSAMARLKIPDGAIIVEAREAIKPMVSLRDVVRPVAGGLQINFPGFLCTLGFNATSGGQASFITNSHCTNTQGGVESTPYYQPTQALSPGAIAVEVADPTYSKSNCPRTIKGRKCRNSDASRARYNTGISFALGKIKKTTGANNSDLTIAGDFSITNEATSSSFTVGSTMNKVGRTTGWTAGPVSATCVHTGVSGSNIVQLCQTHVTAGVGSGDSGSPVFSISSGSNVTLAGILWGGGTNTFVFSPLANIKLELGPLTVH